MKAWLKVVLGSVLVIAVLGAAKAHQIMGMMAFAESFPEPSEHVEISQIAESTFRPAVVVGGEVVTPQLVTLRTQEQGVISGDVVPAGAHVEKGQVLLTLAQEEEQAQLEALLADIEIAELNNQRNSTLSKRGVGSQDAQDQARARLRAAKANAAALRARIEKKTVRAPFTGTLGLHRLSPGHFMHGGDEVVTITGDTKELWVDFKVGQGQVQPVEGTQVSITLPGISGEISGQVISATQQLDTMARTRTYRASVINDGRLTSGMYVRVEYQAGNAKPVLSIKSSAVRASAKGMHVFTLVDAEEGADAPYRAKLVPVNIVYHQGDNMLITGPLQQGTTVATDGAFKLSDGKLAHIGGEVSE